MRELLIRYLLGELDDAEQRQLETRLAQSPELSRELEHLRACFGEVESAVAAAGDPPRGLAERTALQATNWDDDSPPRPAVSQVDPPSSSVGWSLADISVAAGVLLAVSMLLLPALQSSRCSSRRTQCARNLQSIGDVIWEYTENQHGYVPRVRSSDCAGVFAVRLVGEGYISPEKLKRLLICPAASQRRQIGGPRLVITIPNGEKLVTFSSSDLAQLAAMFPNNYCFRIGYVDEKHRYQNYCIGKRPQSRDPIMADAPRFDAFGPRIANHYGYGLNVLYADGSVRYQKSVTVPGLTDIIYLNNANQAAAGQGLYDVVLGVSDATPGVEESASE